jgi:uncharacterized protein with FMN-binding domain
MRRAIPVVIATVGGLVLLANFHTAPGGVNVATAPPNEPTTSAGAAPSDRSTGVPTPGSAPPATKGFSASSSSTTARSATVATAASSATDAPVTRRTINGPDISTRYGDVQVGVSLTGKQIVDVQAIKLPYDRPRSQRISESAAPILRNEALQAQSANIDTVSGASYTSQGYIASLQGALDQANR